MTNQKKFSITKKIAKHGNQSVIIVPRILESQLKPGTIVQLDLSVLQEAQDLIDKKEETK